MKKEVILEESGKRLFLITEAGINRIMKHGEHGMIIISANRSDIDSDNPNTSLRDEFDKWCKINDVQNDDTEQKIKWLNMRNKNADESLKNDLKKSPFAYTPVYGGYHGTDDVVDSYEPSYIVYCHGKKYSADYEPFEKLYSYNLFQGNSIL